MLRKFAFAAAAIGTIGTGAAMIPNEAAAAGRYFGGAIYDDAGITPVHYRHYRHSHRYRPIYRHYGYRAYRPYYASPYPYGYRHYAPYGSYGYRHYGYGGPGISLRFGF